MKEYINLIKKIIRNKKNRIKDPVIKLMITIDQLNLKDLNAITDYSIALRAFKGRLEK